MECEAPYGYKYQMVKDTVGMLVIAITIRSLMSHRDRQLFIGGTRTQNMLVMKPLFRKIRLTKGMSQELKPTKYTLDSEPTLDGLQKKLSQFQKELLESIWLHYLKNDKWPLSRVLHSWHRGKQNVVNHMQGIGDNVVFETNSSDGKTYELTIIGALLTSNGEEYRRMLVSYLHYLREKFQSDPEKTTFSSHDFAKALLLSDDRRMLLGKLVRLSRLTNSCGYGPDDWHISVPHEVEEFPEKGDLDSTLNSFLFRNFNATRTSKEIDFDGYGKTQTVYEEFFGLHPIQQKSAAAQPIVVDALKRRYQVFVSSTFEDLKEERQQVIQALLETKCIPLGMELFPAASMEQWGLIKRVIDECDYYIVIVAGRYGSLSKENIGFTEMEFDYAVQTGKPVIGFYHKSIDSLPGSKLEKTDDGKKRLWRFTEKVKQRLCRPWNSAAELGSAVKSAIINELEFNPKPGWVRADLLPTSDTVEKLKQRIADLEEKIKNQKKDVKTQFPDGKDTLEIALVIRYDMYSNPEAFDALPHNKFEHKVTITWDDFVLACEKVLQNGGSTLDLSEVVGNYFYRKLNVEIVKIIGRNDIDFSCKVSVKQLEAILKTLVAKKLVTIKAGRSSGGEPRWQFTPRGFQYVAELQAIQSSK